MAEPLKKAYRNRIKCLSFGSLAFIAALLFYHGADTHWCEYLKKQAVLDAAVDDVDVVYAALYN